MRVGRRRGAVAGPEGAGDFPKVTQPAANLGPEPNLPTPHSVRWHLHKAISLWRSQHVGRGPGCKFVHVAASGRG